MSGRVHTVVVPEVAPWKLLGVFATVPSDSRHLSLRVPVVRQGEDELETVLVSKSNQLIESLEAISSFVDGSFPTSQYLE
jgi:hypothetical protein